MDVRERLESEERHRLAPHAVCSADTRGREHSIDRCSLRTDFQRDRDRIIHCKSFRRLMYKTQCFLPDEGDHFRTRLSHTLEVAQVARTIARSLRLNEDLTEAIALGHDLGHTCFGHMGERTLDRLCPEGFRHNEQSLRVVEQLERNGSGLNLCWEVRDGILNHCSDGKPATLEGMTVSLADRIAYMNHDIDDAIRAGVLKGSDIPADLRGTLGETHGERIDTLIGDVVRTSMDRDTVAMSPGICKAFTLLRFFLFENVYLRPEAVMEERKADHVLSGLFAHYLQQPELLRAEAPGRTHRERVRDFLAGMTDRFALSLYKSVFLPASSHNDVFFSRGGAFQGRIAPDFDE